MTRAAGAVVDAASKAAGVTGAALGRQRSVPGAMAAEANEEQAPGGRRRQRIDEGSEVLVNALGSQ